MVLLQKGKFCYAKNLVLLGVNKTINPPKIVNFLIGIIHMLKPEGSSQVNNSNFYTTQDQKY